MSLYNPKYKQPKGQLKIESRMMELNLWQTNDARTRFELYKTLFLFDLTRNTKQLITIPLHVISAGFDQYFDSQSVDKTLASLYNNITKSKANLRLHAPSILSTESEVETLFSADVRQILKT